MVSLLPTKFHEILFSSFRGVVLTNCVTDRRTGQKQYVSPQKWGGDIISSNKHGTTRKGAQSGTVLREMLIEATFNQTNFWFIFSQSCDIKSEFSYIICSYLRRLVIQNSLKWDFYCSDSKSDRYFLFKIAIYL
jgi:hypothetical protein